ncbi:MAG: hypothetical protein HOO93_04745 [Methyloglobulus sp.]|nr:hypothetical protein [Methyloglobulus sp.]
MKIKDQMFLILLIFTISLQIASASSCRIGIVPFCNLRLSEPIVDGSQANIGVTLYNVLYNKNKTWADARLMIPMYFDPEDIDKGKPKCVQGGLAHPSIVSQALTKPGEEIKQLLVFEENGLNYSYTLIDISNLKDKSITNVLPPSLGGNNSADNVIASGVSTGNDYDALKAIVNTFTGCNTANGTIIANRMNSYPPNLASNQGTASHDKILEDATNEWYQKCIKFNGSAQDKCRKDAFASLTKIKKEMDKLTAK